MKMAVGCLARGNLDIAINSIEHLQKRSHFVSLNDFYVVISDTPLEEIAKFRSYFERTDLKIIDLGALDEQIPDRIERIRFCRHILQKEIAVSDSDFVILFDSDGVIRSISSYALKRGIGLLDGETFGVGVSGFPFYYDLLALSEEDNFSSIKNKYVKTKNKIVNSINFFKFIFAPMLLRGLSRKIEVVNSCFNGMVVYNMEDYRQGNYYFDIDVNYGCEHLNFHKSISLGRNKRMLIDHRMKFTSFNEHNKFVSRATKKLFSEF